MSFPIMNEYILDEILAVSKKSAAIKLQVNTPQPVNSEPSANNDLQKELIFQLGIWTQQAAYQIHHTKKRILHFDLKGHFFEIY